MKDWRSKMMQVGLGASLLAGGAGMLWMTRAEADGLPDEPSMYYSGRIVEDGVPLASARLRIAVALWTDELSGDRECMVVHPDVPVVDGYFRVALDDRCEDAVRRHRELFAEVTIESDSPLPRTRLGATPYAIEAGNGVPLGTVIDWYRPTPTTPIPDGFAVCDGRTVDDPGSPLFGQPTPDFRGRVARGISGAESVGAEGGSDSVTTSADGQHSHEYLSVTRDAESWWNIHDGAGTYLGRYGDGIADNGSGIAVLLLPYRTEVDLLTDAAPAHQHTVATVPSYVGVLKLMRIR